MKKLLETVTKFAGQAVGQKPGDQWKGTDSSPPGKKLVGDSILKDLSKGPKAKTKEQELAEEWANFMEDDLGVEPKRPGRTSDRPHREYTKHGKPSKRYTPVNEYGKETDNFTAADIKELEGIRDLATLKDRAFALISKPSKRPMKPEKVQWFKSRLDSLTTPIAVIKLMYDLLLSGEGQSVIGSRNSMSSNSYRGRFGEGWGADSANSGLDEGSSKRADAYQSMLDANKQNLTKEQYAKVKNLIDQYNPTKAYDTMVNFVKANGRELNEGWGADAANARHAQQQSDWDKTLEKHKDDPKMTARLKHLRSWKADEAEKAAHAGQYVVRGRGHKFPGEDLEEARSDQVHTVNIVKRSSFGGESRTRTTSGTIPELLKYFGYTLETGKSYEHERGRYKINMNPKNINSLVDNLNKAKSNAARNGAASTYYSVGEAEVDEGVVDTIRKANYNRLADRSFKKAYDAHQDALDAPKTPAERRSARAEFNKQYDKGVAREKLAKELGEGWESGPEERAPRERDPDWEYDQRRQEKADAEAQAAQAKRPQTKVYTLTGRGPNMEPNYKFPGEYASQAEADAARTKLMADPKTPNPRMIGISVHTKYLGEGIESADPVEGAVLKAVQELIHQGHTEVAPEVITNMVVSATSQPFLLKDLVDANKNSPAIQHYVDSINPTKVKFSSDILTVKNENPAKSKAKSTNVVSSMASQAASRPRLGESNTPLRDREDYMAKSKALQDIQVDPHTHQDPQLSAELMRRKAELIQQAKSMGISESRAHKLIANKLKQIELQRKIGSGEQEDGYAQHQRLIKQQQQEYLKKNPNTIYKREIDVDEDMDPPQSGQDTQAAPNQGTNTTANTAININTTTTDPEAKLQAQQALQATQAVKNASGITAPAPNVVKALNTAMTGKVIPGTDSKNLEPMMDIIGQAAQDPKVAQQFKSLAQQANVSK